MNRFRNKYPLAGLPVVVMLAMAPMSTDGKQPAQFVPINSEQLTELVAQTNAIASKAYEYAQSPQTPQVSQVSHDAIKNLDFYKSHKIIHIQDIKGNKAPAALVFCCMPGSNGVTVAQVEYIDNNYLKNPKDAPATVDGLVYHDLGPDKEFCSIMTSILSFEKNGESKVIEREIRVDDNTAQLLIDLLAGDTKWYNSSGIKFYETKRAELYPVKVR